MTTDFVITLKTPSGLLDVVRTIKPESKLTTRTLELFEKHKKVIEEESFREY